MSQQRAPGGPKIKCGSRENVDDENVGDENVDDENVDEKNYDDDDDGLCLPGEGE